MVFDTILDAVGHTPMVRLNRMAGKDSAQVPVDYTRVKNVSKPNGALPGKVIYVNYNTVYVTPGIPS